jgi:hypothetical protein
MNCVSYGTSLPELPIRCVIHHSLKRKQHRKRVSERTPRGTAWWLLLSVKEAPRKPPLLFDPVVKTMFDGTFRRSGSLLIRRWPSVMVIVLSESVFIAAPPPPTAALK